MDKIRKQNRPTLCECWTIRDLLPMGDGSNFTARFEASPMLGDLVEKRSHRGSPLEPRSSNLPKAKGGHL